MKYDAPPSAIIRKKPLRWPVSVVVAGGRSAHLLRNFPLTRRIRRLEYKRPIVLDDGPSSGRVRPIISDAVAFRLIYGKNGDERPVSKTRPTLEPSAARYKILRRKYFRRVRKTRAYRRPFVEQKHARFLDRYGARKNYRGGRTSRLAGRPVLVYHRYVFVSVRVSRRCPTYRSPSKPAFYYIRYSSPSFNCFISRNPQTAATAAGVGTVRRSESAKSRKYLPSRFRATSRYKGGN